MPLILKVVSYRQKLPPQEMEARFDQCGGTIGRADSNDLILLDPEKCISRKHAELAYNGGSYSLVDKSLAGTFVDGSEVPLRGETIELRDGMRLNIGEYEVSVNIADEAKSVSAPFDDDLYSSVCGTELSSNIPSLSDDAARPDIFLDDDSIDSFPDAASGLDSLGGADPFGANFPAQEEQDAIAKMDHVSPFNEHFRPPEPEQNPADGANEFSLDDLFNDGPIDDVRTDSAEPVLPEFPDPSPNGAQIENIPKDANFEPANVPNDFRAPQEPVDVSVSSPEYSMPQLNAENQPPSQSPDLATIDSERLVKAFRDGVGLAPRDLSDTQSSEEVMKLVGSIIRSMTGGIMTVLRGRAEMKSQVRLSMTTVRPVENNFLKFSASVDDALRVMLNPDRKGFLPPLEAIGNAIDDITDHQLALTAGTQAALVEMVKRFDPDHFAKPYKEGLVFSKKAKSWDNYAKRYKATSSQAIEEFFSDEFIRAYEEQMTKLQLIRKK